MKWTTDKPTEPGFYFMRRVDINGMPYGIAQVRSFPFGSGDIYIEVYVSDHWQSLNEFNRDVRCEWAGPIPMPEEA
jgi:hypothetical protein